jgi:hypothetical protein
MKAKKQIAEAVLVEDAIIDNGQVEKVTGPGIYRISIENYHAQKEWMSSSGLVHAKNSLSEYKLYLDGYYDHNDALHFSFGNACELYLIDEVDFYNMVAIAKESEWLEEALAENPNLKTPKASKTFQTYKKAFEEENQGKYIIPDVGEQSFEAVKVLCARCKQDEWISKIIKGAEYQNSFYWIDPETGLKLKTRPDLINRDLGIVIDIKTTLDGSPKRFSRTIAELDYPIQACIQIEGVQQTGAIPVVQRYFWLLLEKNAPFNATLYEFDMGDVLVVMDELKYQLRKLKKAYDEDAWPGYGQAADNKYGILTAAIPNWYLLDSNK